MKQQDERKMKKTVVLCLPHYRSLSFKYMAGLSNLLLFKQNKYEIKNADYMFWLDSDMVVEGDAILRLMEHDKDIVSGLYFKKRDLDPVMYVRRGDLYASPRE